MHATAASHEDALLHAIVEPRGPVGAIGRRREEGGVRHCLALKEGEGVERGLHRVEGPPHGAAVRRVRPVIDEVRLGPAEHRPPVDDAPAGVVGVAEPIWAQDAHVEVDVLARPRPRVEVVGVVVAKLQVPGRVALLGAVRPVQDEVRLPPPVVVRGHGGAHARPERALRQVAVGALALQHLEALRPNGRPGGRAGGLGGDRGPAQHRGEEERPATAHVGAGDGRCSGRWGQPTPACLP
mmetsp:Transcript_112013/g.349083  ORF Transcript_112013/g.349083 Transcript_112013/m.349083 type:complete len:239 (+) Transcript_112013:35-751(+)